LYIESKIFLKKGVEVKVQNRAGSKCLHNVIFFQFVGVFNSIGTMVDQAFECSACGFSFDFLFPLEEWKETRPKVSEI